MKLRKNFPGAAAALMLAAAIAGCSRADVATQAAAPEDKEEAIAVAADPATASHSYPGYLVSDRAVDVVTRIDGTLLRQHYADGDFVKAGQVLFTIESTQYADRVRQAEATLESARSAHEYASSHYAAVKRALESDAVSQMELALAESNMKQAAAAITSAEAALRLARYNLNLCTIKAPVSGRITAPTVSTGSYVDGDDTAFVLATIYDDTSLTAVFSVDDNSLIEMLHSGDKMRSVGLTFDEPLDHAYTGTLNYISPTVDSNGAVQLKAKVENPHGELRNGMAVRVEIPR